MSSDRSRKKILVVDNNPTIVTLIEYALKQGERYDVIAAYNGPEGLERMYTEQPNCVIFDVRITKGDDYHLARFLQAAQAANIPSVILIKAPQEDQVRASLSNADEYLVTPFKPSALHAAIERVLRRGKIEP